MGNRGSVIPVFLEQRRRGKITITDPRMTRFWLTLEQGVKFVIRCLEQMHGGEIFVPKIASMRLLDLAETDNSPTMPSGVHRDSSGREVA